MATRNAQRIELGGLLRKWRTRVGLQPAFIESELGWYTGKNSRIENGWRKVSKAELDVLAQLYKLSDTERESLHRIGEEARKNESPSHIADFAQTYIALQRSAHDIKYFDAELIHGLFQTPDYARALIEHFLELSPDSSDGEAWLQDRMRRQSLLTQPQAPKVSLLLGEGVLHRIVGNVSVTRAQLQHLITVSELPNVYIRILPFTVSHFAVGVRFTLLTLNNPEIQRVCIDGLTDVAMIQEPSEVNVYVQGFEKIWASAISESDSVNILHRRCNELGGTTSECRKK